MDVDSPEDRKTNMDAIRLQWSHVLMDVDSSRMACPCKIMSIRLQWSHVLMDVDRISRGRLSRLRRAASMEPRPDGRG